MQIKTIQKNIQAKLTDWIGSITDSTLAVDLKGAVLVSGGSITSMLLNEEVNDYDIYLTDRNILLRLTEYYAKPFEDVIVFDGAKKNELIDKYREGFTKEEFLNHTGSKASSLRNLRDNQVKLFINTGNGGYKVDVPEENKKPYQPLFFSPNAISLSDDIQIVIRFHGTAEEIHKTFDFIHATNYFTFSQGVVTNKEALESILTKQLKYQGSLYPVTSIIRSKKFVKRLWNINAGELLKIMFQISFLDLTNMDILEEQLIGVDVAYFDLLIRALREHQENQPDFKITPEYFNIIIDKVFNEAE